MQALIEERFQPPRGSSSHQFGGPDMYVAVQVVPDGVEPLKVLNHKFAAMRGIKIIWCGEGYSKRQASPRSMLNRARAEAERIQDMYESGTQS